MNYAVSSRLIEFFKLLNVMDQAIICIFFISMVIGFKFGLKKELLFLILMVVPGAAAAFIPTNLIEDYLSEVIVSKNAIKVLAPSVIYVVFMFITIVLKRSIEGEYETNRMGLSWDSFFGLLYGFLRGYVILVFIILAHAHFFHKPLDVFKNSFIVQKTKNHLLDFDGRFEKLFEHTDKVAKEIEEEMMKKKKPVVKYYKNSLQDAEDIDLSNYPIKDIDSDEYNPDIEL